MYCISFSPDMLELTLKMMVVYLLTMLIREVLFIFCLIFFTIDPRIDI